MKIRRTEFAMVPTWVALHPEMRGHGVRIATYVALRIIAFEFPDYEWKSEREIAESASRVAGCGSEACRKHMRAMRAIGIITGEHGELVMPHDPPSGDTGGDPDPQVGTPVPTSGDTGPQTPISMRDTENPPLTGEAGGDLAGEARAAATGFWDRVIADTGHAPIGIKFMALAKLIERCLKGGYELADVKRAVWTVYSEGRPFTLAVIEQYLDGRRRVQGGSGRHLDALQAAIDAEQCRRDAAQ